MLCSFYGHNCYIFSFYNYNGCLACIVTIATFVAFAVITVIVKLVTFSAFRYNPYGYFDSLPIFLSRDGIQILLLWRHSSSSALYEYAKVKQLIVLSLIKLQKGAKWHTLFGNLEYILMGFLPLYLKMSRWLEFWKFRSFRLKNFFYLTLWIL